MRVLTFLVSILMWSPTDKSLSFCKRMQCSPSNHGGADDSLPFLWCFCLSLLLSEEAKGEISKDRREEKQSRRVACYKNAFHRAQQITVTSGDLSDKEERRWRESWWETVGGVEWGVGRTIKNAALDAVCPLDLSSDTIPLTQHF